MLLTAFKNVKYRFEYRPQKSSIGQALLWPGISVKWQQNLKQKEWSASFHTIDGWCYLFYCKIKHNYMWHWNTMSGMKLDDEDFERLYRLISVYSVCWWWEVTEVIRKHYRVCPQVDKTKFKESLSTILVYTMWYIKKMISQWNRLMIYRKLINYLDNRVKRVRHPGFRSSTVWIF